jgi:hypothetical protein
MNEVLSQSQVPTSSNMTNGLNEREFVGDAVDKFKALMKQRGGTGIRGIAKLLSIMDQDKDKKLTKEELKCVCMHY